MNQLASILKGKPTKHKTLVQLCFDNIEQKLPVVRQVLSKYGSSTVAAYGKKVLLASAESYQDTNDLAEIVIRYVSPLLGESIANRAAVTLVKNKVALTTNHHGVDYFAQSVQGSLLFSLSSQCESVIPIFACGNIPLNNLTYPRGALIYPDLSYKNLTFPIKVPLFPDRLKHCSVSKTPAFNEQMIDRMQKSLSKIKTQGSTNTLILQSLADILEQDYRQGKVLDLSSYSDQSVILNQCMWQRMFKKGLTAPPLVYLELEKIASMLLEYDLKNTTSLAYLLFFEPKALSRLHSELQNINGSGTFLFWGLDSAGRQFQLNYNQPSNSLIGKSLQNEVLTVSIEPAEINQLIKDGRLLPSLFTSFLVIALARGLTCAGGYYQAEYLPKMKQAVVNSLHITTEWNDIIQKIKSVNTNAYLSGMQVVMSQFHGDLFIPSGPLEIIASGGLTSSDLNSLRSITIKEAHTASILETVADVTPDYMNGAEQWEKRRALASETRLILKGSNLIVKNFR